MKKPWSRSTIFVKPTKVYVTLIASLAVLTLLYFMWKKPKQISIRQYSQNFDYMFKESSSQNDFMVRNSVFEGEKIVHLDLKGAPPKIAYYEKLFPLLKKLGATGILIEYEDMFPYVGSLSNISALNAYSLEDVRTINKMAKDNSLKVIPLIQTFGHLEFILKLPEYKEYREVPSYPQSICPTHKNTLTLLTAMMEQMVQAHPDSELIHIGADEVFHLGVCDRCNEAMLKYNLSKNLLFLEHVNRLMGVINRMYPRLRVLMWDDQFRSISLKELKKGNLNKYVEPVIWRYTKDVYDELGPTLWDSYSQTFKKVWVASAFKGATGSSQFVSDTTHYLQNHRSWMAVIAEYKSQFDFQGIIITGWQRYDHFAVLCELLPVGIPALAMSLRLLLGYNDSPLSPPTEVAKLLHCEQPYALIGPVFGSPRCSFPGGDILEYVLRLQQLKQEYESIVEDSRARGWLSEYNIKYVYSNPFYVISVTSSVDRIRNELSQIDVDISEAMFEVYDNYTIDEWKQTYIQPLERKVNTLWEARKAILAKDTWHRRPLKHDEI